MKLHILILLTLNLCFVSSPLFSADSKDSQPSGKTGVWATQSATSGPDHLLGNSKSVHWGKRRIALMYVGHGEPAMVEDGFKPLSFPDGSLFGPHAVELGVPEEFQYTEWAAAYEEIATAIAYIFGDTNGNGIIHEVAIVPIELHHVAGLTVAECAESMERTRARVPSASGMRAKAAR